VSKEIYRKVSLDRLSSPEQLDLILDVTTSRGWIALLALCLSVGAGVAWGVLGATDTTVTGQGVIVRSGGVFNVVSLGSGRVTEIRVHIGDIVQAEQVIALVAQPQLVARLKNSREEIDMARTARDRILSGRAVGDQARRDSLAKQRASIEQEIKDTQEQIRIVKEQIPVDQQLVGKGLITKQTALQTEQKLAQLEGNIGKLSAQISDLQAQEVEMGQQASQMALEHQNRIEDLNRQMRVTVNDLGQSANVVSPNAGRVVEMKVYPGAVVQAGSPIISIEPLVKKLETIAYVSSAQAKEIHPGMVVRISPSGIQREEYGYMLGTVASIADFPATQEAIIRTFENEALARAMLNNGPVTELRVRFLEDPVTQSGYKWSSPKGPPATISSGSVCNIEVVTREEAPVSLVIPYLKKTLGLS